MYLADFAFSFISKIPPEITKPLNKPVFVSFFRFFFFTFYFKKRFELDNLTVKSLTIRQDNLLHKDGCIIEVLHYTITITKDGEEDIPAIFYCIIKHG